MALTNEEKRWLNNATPGLAHAQLGDKIDALIGSTQPASATTAGIVKRGAVVADAAGANPTAAEFKALLDSLRAAGVIATV